MKQCFKCKKQKDLSEFRNDKYTKDGKTYRCKECLRTFKPREIRCLHCRKWFTQKQSNYRFCSPKCHNNYWNKVWRLGKGTVYMKLYHRKYDPAYRKRVQINTVVS